jgi:phosphate/sulfate permease
MGGILLNAYYTIPGYAGLFQFFTSILVAFFAFAVIFILDQYWDGLKMDKYAMAFVVVVTTMASASILEFVKWFQIFGMKSESVERVLISLFISTIAGIIMAMIGVSLIKKGKFEMMTEDLGKQIDSKIIKKRKKNSGK